MASKALREYHSGPLMLVFLFMVSFQHNVPGYLTPVSFENYTPDNVIPVMYPFFQVTRTLPLTLTLTPDVIPVMYPFFQVVRVRGRGSGRDGGKGRGTG